VESRTTFACTESIERVPDFDVRVMLRKLLHAFKNGLATLQRGLTVDLKTVAAYGVVSIEPVCATKWRRPKHWRGRHEHDSQVKSFYRCDPFLRFLHAT